MRIWYTTIVFSCAQSENLLKSPMKSGSLEWYRLVHSVSVTNFVPNGLKGIQMTGKPRAVTLFKKRDRYWAKWRTGRKKDGKPEYSVVDLKIKSKTTAQAWKKGKERELASGREPEAAPPVERESFTVAQLCAAHLPRLLMAYTREHGITTSYSNAKQALAKFEAALGDVPINSLRPRMLRDMVEDWAESGDYARKTLNEYLRRIKYTLEWAVENEMLEAHTFAALDIVASLSANRTNARESQRRQAVSDPVVAATLEKCPPHLQAMIQIQRLTGARPDEICKLRPCDIDRGGAVWIFTPPEHKTAHLGKIREIAIGPKAQAILAPYMDRPADCYCFDPRLSLMESPPPSTTRRYASGAYAQAIRIVCAKHGLEAWTPYQLRHTRLTEVAKDHGLEAAAEIGGNTAKIVEAHYNHRDRELRHKIALESG